MDVLLTLDQFPELSKTSINEGKVPESAIKIVNFLRSTFLLSNSLLHSNNLILFLSKQFETLPNGLIVLFLGNKLRYLAPDEREILFLLLKIQKILSGKGGKSQEQKQHARFLRLLKTQSTPGIYLIRGNIAELWEQQFIHGKDVIIIGESKSTYPKLHSFVELEEKIQPNILLVFNSMKNQEIHYPSVSTIHGFVEDTWRTQFFENELISYIQSKITSRG